MVILAVFYTGGNQFLSFFNSEMIKEAKKEIKIKAVIPVT
jgi:hypothetical protein